MLLILPTYVAIQLVEFTADETQRTKVEWRSATSMEYPVITICHPKMFDKRKMEGTLCFITWLILFNISLFPVLNISENLANYITQTLDPSLAEFYDFMSRDFTGLFNPLVESTEIELQEAMTRLGLTSLEQLFHAISLRLTYFPSFLLNV